MHRASIRLKVFAISNILGLLTAGAVWAADAPAASGWEDKHFNPKPMADDVALPMPCGGTMVFRKVEVPSDGPLDDYPIILGGNDEGRGYSEGAHNAYIAGAFPGGKSLRYTLMAKYDVTELQWAAVMDGQCPTPSLAKRMPKTEVGWFDATAFADRYSQWLRKNALAKLPKDGAEAGYVRLPTEVEWEFAARGGIRVSPSQFQDRLPPMTDGLAKAVWYAGSQSANGKVQLTGLLEPNPLGLFDMLGNVDQIVFEPYALNKLSRPHGQPGGFVVKGGNYLTAEADIHSAYRQELPFYDADAPRRAKTTGFRVVVAGPVLTSADKIKDLKAAWDKLGAVSAAQATPAADPVEELAKISKAVADPATKARLQSVELALRANIASRDEQRDRAVRTSLRLGAFLGRKLADDSKAVDTLAKLYKSRVDAGQADDARTKSFKEELDKEQAVLDEILRYYADTLIRTADDYGEDVVRKQFDLLLVELQGLGLAELKPFVEKHMAHVTAYRKDKKVSRNAWLKNWNQM